LTVYKDILKLAVYFSRLCSRQHKSCVFESFGEFDCIHLANLLKEQAFSDPKTRTSSYGFSIEHKVNSRMSALSAPELWLLPEWL
jgi:hypothetical protein